MKIDCAHDELVDLHKLQPNPKNPNTHPDKQIKLLAKIIDYQGQRAPIVVSNRSGFITKGHGRLDALKKLGWDKAAVDYQDYDDEAQEFADMVADNKISELAKHDDNLMIEALKEVEIEDFDYLGIPDFELPAEVDPAKEEIEDDVPTDVDTRAKPGDLWILGEHRLLCGDATNVLDVERLMGGEKADMVYTDPPYGVNYNGGHFHYDKSIGKSNPKFKRAREKLKADENTNIYKEVIPLIAKYCNGPCYTWFADTKSLDLIKSVNYVGETHAMIIWHKTNAKYASISSQYKQRHEPCLYWKPKGKTLKWCGPSNENTLWEMKRDASNKFHPTQKPVALAERAIKNHTAKSVLDLFGGSGSTLIACEKTNRKCFMSEIDGYYCDVIINRWMKYTGKMAYLHENSSGKLKEPVAYVDVALHQKASTETE